MGKMLRYQSQNLKQESSRKTGYIVSCSEKHKGRSKLEKITDLASFTFYSEKWKSVDHKYNKVLGFEDWNNTDEKYAHKACKDTFFKESFLNSQH